MKFQKKMIILTTVAAVTFGLIACGAAVADSKKDDGAAVKPMAMKSAPAKAGMKGGCSHGAKGGKMGGCSHGAKGGMMHGRMGMKPMAKPIKIQVDDVTIIILVNKDGSAKVAKMGGCDHGAKGGKMGGCDHGAKGGKMGGCDHGAKGGKMSGCEQAAKMDCCDDGKTAPKKADQPNRK